jgi:hypothetical protein
VSISTSAGRTLICKLQIIQLLIALAAVFSLLGISLKKLLQPNKHLHTQKRSLLSYDAQIGLKLKISCAFQFCKLFRSKMPQCTLTQHNNKGEKKKERKGQARACNPSYSGDRDQEDYGSMPAPGK